MKKIFFLLASLLLPIQCYFAQTGSILYTDFNPDLNLVVNYDHPAADTIFLDYDSDGQNDHYFYVRIDVYSWGGDFRLLLKPIDVSWRVCALPLNEGDTISCQTDSLFVDASSVRILGWMPCSATYPQEYYNVYYAVRKLYDNGYHYAWLKTSVVWKNSNDITLSIHEMAYCTEPEYPLRVGQTSYDWGVGQQEETAGLIVQPNPTSGMVAITGSDLERVEVFNPMGQRIESKPIHSDASSFDLSAFPSGVYLLNVADKYGRHCIKKIVIQH